MEVIPKYVSTTPYLIIHRFFYLDVGIGGQDTGFLCIFHIISCLSKFSNLTRKLIYNSE